MRKLILLGGLLSLSVGVLGCPKKDGGGDASADADALGAASDAAAAADGAAAPTAITAKNIASVARFPAEIPIASEAAKVAQPIAARTEPRGGAVVATLKIGSDVTKVSEYQASVLVTFPDPTDATATLVGWVGKEAFTAFVIRDAGKVDAGKLVCASNQLAVVMTKDAVPVCKKKCARDAECKAGAVGSCVNANAVAGNVVRVCAND